MKNQNFENIKNFAGDIIILRLHTTNENHMISAISRAILKPVYWFGIPNSRPPNSQKLKINSSKNRQMTVHALVPQCAEPGVMF